MYCARFRNQRGTMSADQKVNKKVVISGMLGNGLEWYDYALYGQLAFVFADIFFPAGDENFARIMTLLIFAVGFVFRPLGAVLFGRIGDKFGRKKALVTSMLLMAGATGCLGLLPTYETIGIFAPILLVIIRIIQGLSLGGAFSGSMSYVVEHAPANKRATVGSVTILSLVIGFLMGSLVASLVSSTMSTEDFHDWGWRLPFFFGVLIGFVGYYIKEHGEESPAFEKAKAEGSLSTRPVKETFTTYRIQTLQGFSFYMFVTLPFYCIAIYFIGYSKAHLGLGQDEALQINALAMLAMAVPILPAAYIADRIGRKKVLLGAIFAMAIALYPAFHMMQSGEYLDVAIGQCILAFINGWYIAAIPAMLVELFPTRVRYTGMSLSYNFCAILGGFAPAIAEFMIEKTGSNLSIMSIFIATGIASFIALITYKDDWKKPLA
jgi:MHS family proline/betaine transporter-like MFS transporter